MFENLETAPPDSIFGIAEAFRNDPNPAKISLAVGVYRNEEGVTPVLEAVKQAEEILLRQESTKSYLPIQGLEAYSERVQELIFGGDHPARLEGRIVTAHTPGGTGALRVAADFLRGGFPTLEVRLTDPTWANHQPLFSTAGFECSNFAYFDRTHNDLDFEGLCNEIESMSSRDVILLHGCCHNPTGVDPTTEQWERIAELLARRGVLPIVDFAYQGFAQGLDEDATGIRTLAAIVPEMIVCSSFSKNFGLYNERVGAMSVLAPSASAANAALSQVKRCIRANYSNPPAHGGQIVTTVLGDADLTASWHRELATMRRRVREMRSRLAEGLDERGVEMSAQGNGFMVRQRGMFSFSGLTPEQVARLRDEHAIYIVGSGRINVAGLTHENLPMLCDAIAAVTR